MRASCQQPYLFSTFKIKYCKQNQLELTGAKLKKDEQKEEKKVVEKVSLDAWLIVA
jgi:hypothetical protein